MVVAGELTARLLTSRSDLTQPCGKEHLLMLSLSVRSLVNHSSCCYPLSSLHIVLPLLQQLVAPSFPPLMVEVCRKNLRYILLSVIKLLGRFKYLLLLCPNLCDEQVV
jgi:hypothetical protein